jgi:hypothetical protein
MYSEGQQFDINLLLLHVVANLLISVENRMVQPS